MPTSEIKGFVNFEKYKGIYGALSIMVALTFIVIRLPDEQISTINDRWLIITIPSLIVLTITLFSAYLQEQKARTKVEVEFTEKLETLISMLGKQSESTSERLTQIENRLDQVHFSLEKRGELLHVKGDTDKYKVPPQKKGVVTL